MRLEKCWFCFSTIYPGHGIQFVRNDAKMKRNPRKVKWTKAYRRLHGKDMRQDSTFELERKRNRPERYDWNVTEQTLKAIPMINKIRKTRENKNRARPRSAREMEWSWSRTSECFPSRSRRILHLHIKNQRSRSKFHSNIQKRIRWKSNQDQMSLTELHCLPILAILVYPFEVS